MIPRRFFWIFDVLIILLAFIFSDFVSPFLQKMLASMIENQPAWLNLLSPEREYVHKAMVRYLWILMVSPLPMIVFLDMDGDGKWIFQSPARIILSGPAAALIGISLVSLVPFVLRNSPMRVSRSFLFAFGILSAIGLSAYRLAIRGYYKRRKKAGYYVRNVVLVGLPSAIERMKSYFKNNINPREYRIFGRLDTDDISKSNPNTKNMQELKLNGNPAGNDESVLGHVSQLGQLLIQKPIHEVIAIQPANGGEWMSQVIHDCDNLGILLRIVPEPLMAGHTVRLRALLPLQPLHLPAVVLAPPNLDSDALFIKRLIDIVVSALLLALLSPFLLLIAVVIKITTPKLGVFYPWHVVGRNGVHFIGYKFTTMVADADDRRAGLMLQNEMTGPAFKIKNDPRVTPLGKILRKFDLNELPQLWSVLKGDMSLVGPRPAGPHELVRYDFWQKRKLSIRPGITCLWQVRGRNKISDFGDWVRMDLEYIDTWSLWLDLKILLRTIFVVLRGTGS
jgi:exopolysaccharide biosynthesis polyprenyl glycosylphosphotransferase